MKTVSIPMIAGTVFTTITLNMINLSFAFDNEQPVHTGERFCRSNLYTHPGYKPVPDKCQNLEDTEELLRINNIYIRRADSKKNFFSPWIGTRVDFGAMKIVPLT